MYEDRIKSALAENYTLYECVVTFIRESSDNVMYKVVCGVDVYVFRVSLRQMLNPNDIAFELEVIDVANSKQVKVPELVKNSSGEFLTVVDGKLCVLMKYIDGVHIANSVDAIPSSAQVFNGGVALAGLHNAWEQYNPVYEKSRTLLSEFERFLNHEDFFATHFENGSEVVATVHEYYAYGLKNQTNEIMHNDFRTHNIFYEKEGDDVLAIIDFDWACKGNYFKDLAHSIVEWSTPDGLEVARLELAQAFLNGYVSKRKVSISLEELKQWMRFACIGDALTYWTDRKDSLAKGSKLSSYMYGKAKKVDGGQFDGLMSFSI